MIDRSERTAERIAYDLHEIVRRVLLADPPKGMAPKDEGGWRWGWLMHCIWGYCQTDLGVDPPGEEDGSAWREEALRMGIDCSRVDGRTEAERTRDATQVARYALAMAGRAPAQKSVIAGAGAADRAAADRVRGRSSVCGERVSVGAASPDHDRDPRRVNSGRAPDRSPPGTSSIDRYRIDPPADAPPRPGCLLHRTADVHYVAIPVASADSDRPAIVRGWACSRCWVREEAPT